MVTLLRQERKSAILTPSSIPCLSHLPTINITQGCMHGCRYCYTRNYANYPGDGVVALYENLPERLAAELKRKRKQPRRVYFSPSSDAFQPMHEIRAVTFDVMKLLLDAGIEIAFLTKGLVNEPFIKLFADAQPNVYAQVGLTTAEPAIASLMEPHAAAPTDRLATIQALASIGVSTTARLDPLIPDLTDTPENLKLLFEALQKMGISQAVGSYMFVRGGLTAEMGRTMRQLNANLSSPTDWPWHKFADGTGSGRMLGKEQREKRFAEIRTLAQAFGIDIAVCACKNPDIPSTNCRIAGPPIQPIPQPTQFPLFE